MSSQQFLSLEEVRALLPFRAATVHKGDCGRVLVVAGTASMMGAALLCAKAAFRSGAGMVYLASGESFVQQLTLQLPELITLPLPEEEGAYGPAATQALTTYFDEFPFSAIVIGPGLGRDDRTKAFIQAICQQAADRGIAGVIDADAFYALSPDLFKTFPMNSYVLTPHPKEFSVFSGLSYDENNRFELAETLAQEIQQILILKGHHSVVAYAGTAVLNPTGNPGMATAGSGDVLAGLVAGFIAQGVMACDAACLGPYLHGLAGDLAVKSMGEHALLASDIIDALPAALQALEL